jgi:hypothetical protein
MGGISLTELDRVLVKPRNREDNHPVNFLKENPLTKHSGNKAITQEDHELTTIIHRTIDFPFKAETTQLQHSGQHKPKQLSQKHFITRVKSRMAKRDIPVNRKP